MKIYTKLSKEDAVGIPADTLVYITCDAKALHQCPSFVLGCVPDGCLVAVCGQQSPSPDDEFPFSTYGDDWYVEIQNGFTIETPDGTLHVWGKQGDNYPGVYHNRRKTPAFRPGDIRRQMALLKYICRI